MSQDGLKDIMEGENLPGLIKLGMHEINGIRLPTVLRPDPFILRDHFTAGLVPGGHLTFGEVAERIERGAFAALGISPGVISYSVIEIVLRFILDELETGAIEAIVSLVNGSVFRLPARYWAGIGCGGADPFSSQFGWIVMTNKLDGLDFGPYAGFTPCVAEQAADGLVSRSVESIKSRRDAYRTLVPLPEDASCRERAARIHSGLPSAFDQLCGSRGGVPQKRALARAVSQSKSRKEIEAMRKWLDRRWSEIESLCLVWPTPRVDV